MPTAREPHFSPVAIVLAALVFCAAFAAALRTPLLYFSNQNTKFLQGLANAFPDQLGSDWMAQTTDGLPAFSFIVYAVARFTDPAVFYLIQLALLAVMCLSLLAIAQRAAPAEARRPAFVVAVAALIVFFASDDQRDALRGVAGQYMTDGYFQPAEFGILYLPALLLAARGKAGALVLAALPAIVHPTYIALSAMLVGIFAWHFWREGRGIPVWPLVVALACIAVPPIDLALRFAPTDPETFERANDILAFQRIPHHSDPAEWIRVHVWRKLAIALIAIAVAPRGVFRTTLIVLIAYAALGSVAVWLTGNAELALIAPWRVSILIVPVSLALVTGAVIGFALRRLPGGRVQWLLPLVALGLAGQAVALGVAQFRADVALARPAPYIAHIRQTAPPDAVYLTNPDDSDFRLRAMQPQYITWKSHPYLDTEVIAWFARVQAARRVFGKNGSGAATGFDCAALQAMLPGSDITHIVLAADDPGRARALDCPVLVQEFSGDGADVYAIRQAGRGLP